MSKAMSIQLSIFETSFGYNKATKAECLRHFRLQKYRHCMLAQKVRIKTSNAIIFRSGSPPGKVSKVDRCVDIIVLV